LKQEFELQKNH
jgi:hypothetical protein